MRIAWMFVTVDSKGYGIATPKGSRWKDKISQAILYLQEKSSIQVSYSSLLCYPLNWLYFLWSSLWYHHLITSTRIHWHVSVTFCFRWSTTNGGSMGPKGVPNRTETGPRPLHWMWSTLAACSWSCSVALSSPSSSPSQNSVSNSGETRSSILPSSGKKLPRNLRVGHLCGSRSWPRCYPCSEENRTTPRTRQTAPAASHWLPTGTGWGICEPGLVTSDGEKIWKQKDKS